MATDVPEDLSKRPSIPDDRLVLYVKKGEFEILIQLDPPVWHRHIADN